MIAWRGKWGVKKRKLGSVSKGTSICTAKSESMHLDMTKGGRAVDDLVKILLKASTAASLHQQFETNDWIYLLNFSIFCSSLAPCYKIWIWLWFTLQSSGSIVNEHVVDDRHLYTRPHSKDWRAVHASINASRMRWVVFCTLEAAVWRWPR